MKVRTSKPTEISNNRPLTSKDWSTLCRKALERAEAVGDRRAAGLKAALEKGTAQRTLTVLGIICQADIERTFVQ